MSAIQTISAGKSAIIQIDSREQCPLEFGGHPFEVVGLPCGDYGLAGFSDWSNPAFICERKSLEDLISSLTSGRERFMREIERLRRFRFGAILIEARRETVQAGEYRSNATPQSILASIDAIIVRTGVHVFWCSDHEGAANQFLSLTRQFERGIEKNYKRLLSFRMESANDRHA